MAPTAEDFATRIINAMKAPNYYVIITVRDADQIYGWLNLEKKAIEEGSKELKDAWEVLAQRTVSYVLGECYGGSSFANLKDRIGAKTLGKDEAIDSLCRSDAEGIARAVEDLAAHVTDGGDRLKNIASQLLEEVKVLCDTVEREIEDSHKLLEVGHFASSTASPPPDTHKEGAEGQHPVDHEYQDTVNKRTAKWKFAVYCVDDDGSNYVLPTTTPHHWQIAKDDPITVTFGNTTVTTKAPDKYSPNKDADNKDNPEAFVKGLLEEWPLDKTGWYGKTASTEADPPSTHQGNGAGTKQVVGHEDENGMKWSFRMVHVNENESLYVLPDSDEGHHWRINKDEKISVERSNGVKSETVAPDHISFGQGVTDAAGAVKFMIERDGPGYWYPARTQEEEGWATSSDPPISHRPGGDGYLQVDAQPDAKGVTWTFGMVLVNEDETRYFLPNSDQAHHHRINQGEVILVKRPGGPEQRRAAQENISFPPGMSIDAVPQRILDDHGGEDYWYPPAGGYATNEQVPASHQPGGDGYLQVEEQPDEKGVTWTFGMVLVNENETLYVLPDSEDAHHWRINEGDKVVVKRPGGGEKEVTAAANIRIPFGMDVTAMPGRILADHGGEEQWYPPSAEEQLAAEEERRRGQQLEEASGKVKAKIDSVQTAVKGMRQFVPRHLQGKPGVQPMDLRKQNADWGSLQSSLAGLSGRDIDADLLARYREECLELVAFVEDKGGSAPEIDELKRLSDELQTELKAYQEVLAAVSAA